MREFDLGSPVPRTEDFQLLRGRGRYVDDIVLPRQAHLYVLRSPHAAARIKRIDAKAAEALPGVLAVLTGKDADADKLGTLRARVSRKRPDGSPNFSTPYRILALDRVRHVGDPVAAIVAETHGARQGCGRARRGRIRNPALGHRHRRDAGAGRAQCVGRIARQYLLRRACRQRGEGEGGLRPGQARDQGTLRHQPRRGQPDGGAHRARRSTTPARNATFSMPGCRRRI